MEIRKLFGLNLRRYRIAAAMSQEALAAEMGVDRAHVSSMERGQQNVTLLTLAQVAKALNIEPMALLDFRANALAIPASLKAPRKARTKQPG